MKNKLFKNLFLVQKYLKWMYFFFEQTFPQCKTVQRLKCRADVLERSWEEISGISESVFMDIISLIMF